MGIMCWGDHSRFLGAQVKTIIIKNTKQLKEAQIGILLTLSNRLTIQTSMQVLDLANLHRAGISWCSDCSVLTSSERVTYRRAQKRFHIQDIESDKMSLQLDYPLFIGLALFVVVILSTVFYLGEYSDDLFLIKS